MASRLVRANPVTVNDVLDGHVKLDLECLDRVYLHGFLAQLQVGGHCSFGSLHVLCTVASDAIRRPCTSRTFGVMCTLRNTSIRLPGIGGQGR
jgi:hypothetical protein